MQLHRNGVDRWPIIFVLRVLLYNLQGVDILAEAIEDAQENCKVNRVTNATFLAGPAEDLIPAMIGQATHELLVAVVGWYLVMCYINCMSYHGLGRELYFWAHKVTLLVRWNVDFSTLGFILRKTKSTL